MRLMLSGVLVAATSLPGAAATQASFAGSWSVLITTTRGACDKAYRYAVVIAPDGAISYGGANDFQASGRIQPDGSVRVTISRGDDAAQGSGRLSGSKGSGRWSAPNGACAGTWRAERRN
jgi:hypothetical protein